MKVLEYILVLLYHYTKGRTRLLRVHTILKAMTDFFSLAATNSPALMHPLPMQSTPVLVSSWHLVETSIYSQYVVILCNQSVPYISACE